MIESGMVKKYLVLLSGKQLTPYRSNDWGDVKR
jgi:hypothetical protein